jgi:hypothetical protein
LAIVKHLQDDFQINPRFDTINQSGYAFWRLSNYLRILFTSLSIIEFTQVSKLSSLKLNILNLRNTKWRLVS